MDPDTDLIKQVRTGKYEPVYGAQSAELGQREIIKESPAVPAWCLKWPKGYELGGIVLDNIGALYLCHVTRGDNLLCRAKAKGFDMRTVNVNLRDVQNSIFDFLKANDIS